MADGTGTDGKLSADDAFVNAMALYPNKDPILPIDFDMMSIDQLYPSLETTVGQQGVLTGQLEDERARVSMLEQEIVNLNAERERVSATALIKETKASKALQKIGSLAFQLKQTTAKKNRYRRERDIARRQLNEPLTTAKKLLRHRRQPSADSGSSALVIDVSTESVPTVVTAEKEVVLSRQPARDFYQRSKMRSGFGGTGQYDSLRMFADGKSYCGFTCALCRLMKSVVDLRIADKISTTKAKQSGLFEKTVTDLQKLNNELERNAHTWNQCVYTIS